MEIPASLLVASILGMVGTLMTVVIFAALLRITQRKYVWFFALYFFLPILHLLMSFLLPRIASNMDVHHAVTLVKTVQQVINLCSLTCFYLGSMFLIKDFKNLPRESWFQQFTGKTPEPAPSE